MERRERGLEGEEMRSHIGTASRESHQHRCTSITVIELYFLIKPSVRAVSVDNRMCFVPHRGEQITEKGGRREGGRQICRTYDLYTCLSNDCTPERPERKQK